MILKRLRVRALPAVPSILSLAVTAGGCTSGTAANTPTSDGGRDAQLEGGTVCNSAADCPQGGVCGFLQSEACAAVGHCFPAPTGPRCGIASSIGCGCNGSDVSIDPSCYTGLPSGYQTKRVLHEGPCTDASPSPLTWFATCGTPVCFTQLPDGGPLPDAGLRDDAGAPCPQVGSSCSSSGETCGTRDPYVNCGAIEMCSDHDPKMNVGGCPISSRKFKDDIKYVDRDQLQQLHDEALRIRLATYSYKPAYEESNGRHLGFIIEDNPESPAVQSGRDRVDMYGYVSMAVAAMQIQEKEIEELRHELDELRAERTGACGP